MVLASGAQAPGLFSPAAGGCRNTRQRAAQDAAAALLARWRRRASTRLAWAASASDAALPITTSRSNWPRLRAKPLRPRRELMNELEALQDETRRSAGNRACRGQPPGSEDAARTVTSLTTRLAESEGEVAKLQAALKGWRAVGPLRSLKEKTGRATCGGDPQKPSRRWARGPRVTT